jgi:hypothetical protein
MQPATIHGAGRGGCERFGLQHHFSQHRARRRRYVIDTSQHIVERFAPIRDIGPTDPHPRRLFDATRGTVQTTAITT